MEITKNTNTNGKYIYFLNEGNKNMKELLGGKGANLAEMCKLDLPVPPGFTITTECCNDFYNNNKSYPKGLKEKVADAIKTLESIMGKKLGDRNDPLLLAVRSGAAVSMPGMMDTVLNLGLNDDSTVGLAKKTNNERFAWDSYRRFIQMFSDVVMGLSTEKFEEILDKKKHDKKIKEDVELNVDDLKDIVKKYKEIYKNELDQDFPQDPNIQLWEAIGAVFGSWNNKRAIAYRRINNIHGLIGTAVNVMCMVFGNMGQTSGTGVAFSRNPSTGENTYMGEFLINAQGEDVVAGIRTPNKLEELKQIMPECFNEIISVMNKLENHFKDMQDIEFTIQEGKLYMLQCRNGKRTAQASIKIAMDMLDEKIIDEKEALLLINPSQFEQLMHKQIDPKKKKDFKPVGKGLAASPGAGVGIAVFTAEKAEEEAKKGKVVILIRKETSPKDIEGMFVSAGILTARGGITSHAALVCRQFGKCCVAGCSELSINEDRGSCTINGKHIREGEDITLDGNTGEIYLVRLPVIEPTITKDFERVMKLADKYKKLTVKANVDTPQDAKKAREWGAEGIGLVRTEHMFFESERILEVRKMICAESHLERQKSLNKLLPFQREDFYGIMKEMTGLPVEIRLLDPPLHEFLPKCHESLEEVSNSMGIIKEKLEETVNRLTESNPMFGFRGCRLGIVYPEINKMQIKAILEAALQLKEEGFDPKPWIEVPLVGNVNEFDSILKLMDEVDKELGVNGKVEYKRGCMIEVPRAALTADQFAKNSDFFSFGTNDLTQMTLGISRDDVSSFIGSYLHQGIYKKDPFVTIDKDGVGVLMKMTVEKARSTNDDIIIGICGEHGGDPESIEFCHKIGLNNVSSSILRIPVAKLAAAHAAIKEKKEN